MFSKHSLCSVHNNDNPNRFCDFVKIASFRPDFQKGNTWSMGLPFKLVYLRLLSTVRTVSVAYWYSYTPGVRATILYIPGTYRVVLLDLASTGDMVYELAGRHIYITHGHSA